MHWQPDPIAWKIALAVALLGWVGLAALGLLRGALYRQNRSAEPTAALPDNVIPLFPPGGHSARP